MKKKFIWMILAVVVAFSLAACLPGAGGGGGGGTATFEGQVVGGEGGTAAPAGDGTATAAPAQGGTAEPQQAGGMGDMLTMLLPFVLMFAVVYFLIMRPQRKQAKQVKEMQAALGVGDNVMTNTGFFGKIVGVGTDCFMVEFGEGGRSVKVPVRKTDIAGVRSPVMTPPPRDGEVIEDKKK